MTLNFFGTYTFLLFSCIFFLFISCSFSRYKNIDLTEFTETLFTFLSLYKLFNVFLFFSFLHSLNNFFLPYLFLFFSAFSPDKIINLTDPMETWFTLTSFGKLLARYFFSFNSFGKSILLYLFIPCTTCSYQLYLLYENLIYFAFFIQTIDSSPFSSFHSLGKSLLLYLLLLFLP